MVLGFWIWHDIRACHYSQHHDAVFNYQKCIFTYKYTSVRLLTKNICGLIKINYRYQIILDNWFLDFYWFQSICNFINSKYCKINVHISSCIYYKMEPSKRELEIFHCKFNEGNSIIYDKNNQINE